MKPEVGQTVYVKWNRQRHMQSKDLEPVVVTKVGRKWAYFSRDRFHVDQLYVDAGEYASPGSVYFSQEDYSKEVRRNVLWQDLIAITSTYRIPKHLTIQNLENALVQLRKPENE